MTKCLIIFLLVLGLFMMFSVADLKAATSQNIWITVSCTATVHVFVVNNFTTNWSVTNVGFNFVTNRSVATSVSNDGNVTETLNLALMNEGMFGTTGWSNSASTNNAQDIYVLQGLFAQDSSGQPPSNVYSRTNGSDDVITLTPQDCSSTIFGDTFQFTDTGVSVGPGDKRDLWLKLQVPSGGLTQPDKPTMRCIISATAL